ncbi:hypothetical protein ACQEVG_32770 [Streptomyces sp. CA-135486]|uniref:hypothetical protein n=1 Tax=Streptomyces sp. CA-135486 TaxID=3240049 RepID=UPI003D919106
MKIDTPMMELGAAVAREMEAEERRQAEQRAKFVAAFTRFVGALAMLPVQAWALMLVFGAVHSMAAPVAAVSYATALGLVLGLDLAAYTTKKFRK